MLAGHSYAFRDRPLGEALDELAGLGFSTVEVWIGHAADGGRAVLRALEIRALTAVAVSAGGVYEAGGDLVRRAAELAEAVGAPVVAAVVLPELLPEAAAATAGRAQLCLENHWDHPLARPPEILRALQELPQVGACLDTGHAIDAGVAAAGFAADLGDRLKHVHLKDAQLPGLLERGLPPRLRRRFLGAPERVFPGTGDLDVAAVFAALRATGYRGAVTAEYEGATASAALAKLAELWEAATEPEGSSAEGRTG